MDPGALNTVYDCEPISNQTQNPATTYFRVLAFLRRDLHTAVRTAYHT